MTRWHGHRAAINVFGFFVLFRSAVEVYVEGNRDCVVVSILHVDKVLLLGFAAPLLWLFVGKIVIRRRVYKVSV